MSEVYFTSDLHFGHRLVAKLRGFEDVHAHDAALIANWCNVVKPSDIVWVLGDVAVSQPADALEILQALPGTKHLIAGNHDKCHPMHRDAHRFQRTYLAAFDSVQAFARRHIHGQDVLLSHFPYEADRGEKRCYSQYRLRREGLWLLHGHTHKDEKRESSAEIHVGLDAWDLKPVHLNELEKIIVEEDGLA